MRRDPAHLIGHQGDIGRNQTARVIARAGLQTCHHGTGFGPVGFYRVPADMGLVRFFRHQQRRRIVRVPQGALGGGVSRSLALDQYGKALSAALLGLCLDVPETHRVYLLGYP